MKTKNLKHRHEKNKISKSSKKDLQSRKFVDNENSISGISTAEHEELILKSSVSTCKQKNKTEKYVSKHREFSCFMVIKLYFRVLKGCYNPNKNYGLRAGRLSQLNPVLSYKNIRRNILPDLSSAIVGNSQPCYLNHSMNRA